MKRLLLSGAILTGFAQTEGAALQHLKDNQCTYGAAVVTIAGAAYAYKNQSVITLASSTVEDAISSAKEALTNVTGKVVIRIKGSFDAAGQLEIRKALVEFPEAKIVFQNGARFEHFGYDVAAKASESASPSFVASAETTLSTLLDHSDALKVGTTGLVATLLMRLTKGTGQAIAKTSTRVQEENERLNQHIQTLQQQLDSAPIDQTAEVERLNQHIQDLQQKLDSAPVDQTAEVDRLNQHIQTLQQQLDSAPIDQTAEVERLNQHIQTLRQELAAAPIDQTARVEELNQQIQTLRQELAAAPINQTAEVAELNQQIQKLNRLLQLRNNDSTLSSFEKTIAAQRDEIQKLQKDLSTARLEKVMNSLPGTEAATKDLETQIEELTEERERLTTELKNQRESLTQELSQLQQQHKALTKEKEAVDQNFEKMQTLLEAAQTTARQAQNDAAESKRMLGQERDNHKTNLLNARQNAKKEGKYESEAEINRLKLQVQNLQHRLDHPTPRVI